MPNDQQVYGGVEYSVTVKWPLDFAFVADGPGPVALTPGMTLGPYETYSATFECAGIEASGSENDVEVEGTFTEAVTGRTESPRAQATVVRVELKAKKTAPANVCVNRHRFGVYEVVDCWHEPGFPGVVWTLEGGGTTNNALEGFVENQTGKGVLRCPLTDNGATLKVSCGDADYWPTIQIVEPDDVVAEKVDYRISDRRPAGAAGGISLVTSLYVHPKDVNFEEIALEEIPWEQGGSVSGYYAQPSKLADRYHDRNHGAGHWHDVTDGNFWWKDGAGSKAITNWFAGTKIWDAPIGWNVKGKKFGYDYVKMIGSSSSFQQMFTIEADGTFRLDKFGRWVSRGVCPDGEAPDDAQILLDGGERNLAEDTERWINENNQGESVTIWW